ncbi:myelin expression factor 2 isoform X3 [Parasteatoda tepidariorum]|uniref:myelin expression factor 2 isoform X3 n=1 Tax=Parasteatoda tepidariorum TaxID=114398 RepID=UPI000A2C03A4|nr:myelin expression factor 2 isoform X3 [Parasteatoda tepidariorum]
MEIKRESRSPFRKNFNERSTYEDDFKKRRRDHSPRRSSSSSAKNRVFVNNIPFECRWMEIKDLFREKVGDVAFVELFEDDSGKFKGCGVVEFKDAETASKAIEVMHKYEVRGRPLNVKLDSGESERKRSSGRTSDREFMRGSDNFGGNDFREPQFNTYGLNPEFLKSLGINGPLNNKVFISNLDYKVTEKKLEEIFKIAGKLVKVELNVDNEGKSKGHGTAEYENPLEAVQAISMFNGQRLYARIMNVRMDKFSEDGDLPSKLPTGLHGIGKGLGVNGQPMQFNKNSNPVGSFGFGLGISGNVAGGMPGNGIGVGSSNMGMMSSAGMGLGAGSMGMNNSMTADRMMGTSSLGMGLSSANMVVSSASVGSMGLGSSSGMMSSSSVLGRSLDGVGRDSSYQMSNASRGFRDAFDRGSDSFNSSNISDTILLGNLPSTFSWQSLKDRFRDIGDVRYAELKGQGNAIIRFTNMQDAQRAVDLMNGYRMDGRAIQVRFY